MRELENMRTDLERLFGDFFEPFPRSPFWLRRLETGMIVPKVDMYEKDGKLVVKAEIPGVDKENIELSITKDALTIKGEVKKEEEVKEKDYHLLERNYGSFNKTIPLTEDVDSDKAEATYKNGVLEIKLPRKKEAKPKEIKISSN